MKKFAFIITLALLSFTYAEPYPIPQTFSKVEKRFVKNIMLHHLEPVSRIYKQVKLWLSFLQKYLN